MIINLFPTPIISEKLDMDLDSLSKYALSVQEFFPAGIKKSNLGGWHSNLLKEENFRNKEMKKLLELTANSLHGYKNELGIKENLELRITGSWININRRGNINRIHVHPNCHFTATFYFYSLQPYMRHRARISGRCFVSFRFASLPIMLASMANIL